ncbi:MAG: amidohydrolase [Parcubacteria group bacterium]|jgi:5-methylthioadenosine/S-adenosylhomocysteine deaminase
MKKNKLNLLSLINTHTHAAMVAFRGMAEDLPLKVWLEKHIWPAEAKMVNPDFVYRNTKKAIIEMRKNDIEAFCDMYFFEEEVARAASELKMYVVIGEVILDFPTPSAKNADESLAITEKLLKKYKNNKYVKVAVAPHSIYAVSRKTLVKCRNLAKKYNVPTHIHLAETKFEFDECMKKNKCTPVEYLDKLGMLNEKTILAHCVWVTDKDIKILAKRKANVAHCPLSNLKLGSGIAPVAKMIEKGVNVALGTDGAASSNCLDIWEAGKFAALLQKGMTGDPTQIPARTAIEMMTINGMKALGIKKIKNKNQNQIKKDLGKIKDFSFLYE